jgi:hypothetical protein
MFGTCSPVSLGTGSHFLGVTPAEVLGREKHPQTGLFMHRLSTPLPRSPKGHFPRLNSPTMTTDSNTGTYGPAELFKTPLRPIR